MTHLRSLSLRVLASALFAAVSVATLAHAQQIAPDIRITGPIDTNQRVLLKGNVLPVANSANDRGAVSASLPMQDLVLVLSRSPEKQAAFDAYVEGEYDSSSPNFHQWLTAEEIGNRFGPSATDIATITNWLAGQGFTVSHVSKDGMAITFSGTAGQVQSAFRTSIHNLSVNGVAHIANMTNPQIPAALAPVVVGIKQLHDFHPHPLHRLGGIATRDPETGQWMRTSRAAFAASHQLSGSASANTESTTTVSTVAGLKSSVPHPQFGISVPASGNNGAYRVEDVAPYDFATIYNVLPLWNTSIDGTGQTIAIVGTTDIQPSDVTTFRSTFGLPAGLTPIQMKGVNGIDPGVCTDPGNETNPPPCTINDLYENTLDVEWSGAVAKGAQIKLVTSGYNSTASNDPIYQSASYIVDNNTAKIMNVSYGLCELGEGTAGNVAYYNLWKDAAAAGIAVFVATGDSGSPACDQGADSGGVPVVAEYGLSVNGLASTPYNTAVGGTDFNWCSLTSSTECTAAPYWNSTNDSTTKASAAGYVPEIPWNDTCTSSVALPFLKNFFSSVVTVNDAEQACNAIVDYASSLNQQGYGVILDFVDVVGTGGGASGCVVNDNSDTTSCSTTITSTGSSYGSLPLYHDGWPKPSWQSASLTGMPSDGVRDIPDVSFFAADGFLSGSAYLICVTDVAAGLSCNYSATSEPSGEEVGGTSVASPAMAGVEALVNQKWGNQGLPNASLYAIAAKQNYSNCKAESATTGNGCYFNDVDTSTNAMACDYGAGGYLSPNCTVTHSGDQVGILSGYSATAGYDLATGLGSLNVANVVNVAGVWANNPTGSTASTVTVTPASTSISPNQSLQVTITVAGASGTPTRTVTLSGGGYTSAATTLSSGSASITIPAGSFSGSGNPFTVTLTANYSGDATYAQATGTSAVITVTKLTPAVAITPLNGSTNSNIAYSVTVAVTGAGGAPTGTVTLAGGGYSATETIGTSPCTTAASCSFTIPANKFTTTGNVPLTANYSGDNTYISYSGSATVTVTYIQVQTPTVTLTPSSSTINSSQGGTITVSVTGTNGVATGTISLSGGGYSSTAETIGTAPCTSATSCVFTIPANSFTSFGSVTITAHYNGDADYLAATGTTTITVNQSMYALSATTPAAITAGGSATSTVTGQTSSTGYTGTVTLKTCTLQSSSVTNPVDSPTCTVSGTITYAGGTASGSGTATVSTTNTAMLETMPGGNGWLRAGGGVVLALLVFLGIPARRRSWRALLGMAILMAVAGSLSACGGGINNSGGGGGSKTSAGTYTFAVSGQGNDPASTTESTTFTVTVN